MGGLAFASGMLALAGFVCWVGRLAIGAITWIKHGEWPQYLVFQLLHDVSISPPETKLLGIQKVINWTMEQSAAWAFFVLFGLLSWLAASCADAANRCTEEHRRAQRLAERRKSHPQEYTFDDLVNGKEPPEQR
jgi:hypothetical protein